MLNIDNILNNEVKENDVVEEVEENDAVEEVEALSTKIGTIVNCNKVYVRKKPEAASEPVLIIKKGTIVEVSEQESVGDFYKVYLENGFEGFIVKDYVEVE